MQMVYGSVRVAVLLYTLWPFLAGPTFAHIFNLRSSSRCYSIPSQHWDAWLTLQPMQGQTVGVCVCLYQPRKARLGPACGSVPMYLTPAPSQLFEPACAYCEYLLFKHRLPIRTFLPCENETKKQQK